MWIEVFIMENYKTIYLQEKFSTFATDSIWKIRVSWIIIDQKILIHPFQIILFQDFNILFIFFKTHKANMASTILMGSCLVGHF